VKSVGGISGRIAQRELDERSSEGGRERIIGRRLKEGWSHYKRYLDIMNVISRFGFGYAFDKVRSVNPLPRLVKADKEVEGRPRAVRIREMFEELGPTFVKVGQVLTTQATMVPDDILEELEKLKGDVEPMPLPEVEAMVKAELGKGPDEAFARFGRQPVGSASIGQVYRARTHDGRKVAVKVQRTDAKETILADLKIMEDLAEVLGDLLEVGDVMDPMEMVEEFRRTLTRELDYTVEGRSIESFRRDFEGVGDVFVPQVYWKLTTNRVLTMDFVDGIPAGDPEAIRAAGIDPAEVALTIGKAMGRMIFVKGHFHGDPHGRNIFVLKGGRVAFLDFGAVGYLDGRMKDRFRLFYLSVAREDIARAADILVEVCDADEAGLNRPALEQDLREFFDYQRLRREGHELQEGMNRKLASVALKHGFAPPAQFVTLERALLESEEVCRALSPDFDINKMLMPILGELIRDKVSEALDPIAAIRTAQDYRELARKGPRRVSSILRKLDAGELEVKVDQDMVRELRRDMWRITLTLSVTIMAAALLFVVAFMGMSLETPLLGISVIAGPIVVVRAVAVWYLYRRYEGPR
jgi:ubiquinone biosynthesis protein